MNLEKVPYRKNWERRGYIRINEFNILMSGSYYKKLISWQRSHVTKATNSNQKYLSYFI